MVDGNTDVHRTNVSVLGECCALSGVYARQVLVVARETRVLVQQGKGATWCDKVSHRKAVSAERAETQTRRPN